MSIHISRQHAGKRVLQAAGVCAFGFFMAIAPNPSLAAIECEGNFQVLSNGALHNSPYCEDLELAYVARQAGMNVSFRAVRQNPSVKERACRLVGYDLRVRDTCQRFLGRGRSRHF